MCWMKPIGSGCTAFYRVTSHVAFHLLLLLLMILWREKGSVDYNSHHATTFGEPQRNPFNFCMASLPLEVLVSWYSHTSRRSYYVSRADRWWTERDAVSPCCVQPQTVIVVCGSTSGFAIFRGFGSDFPRNTTNTNLFFGTEINVGHNLPHIRIPYIALVRPGVRTTVFRRLFSRQW